MADTQMGKEPAACTSATAKGSRLRPVISQPDAALYIQPPTLETTVAVQITANAGWRNGASKEARLPEISLALLIPRGYSEGAMPRRKRQDRHQRVKLYIAANPNARAG